MTTQNMAERYRRRAKQLRTIAKDLTDGETKTTLVSLAEQYEWMASGAEAQAANSDRSKPSEENKRAWRKLGLKLSR